MSAEASSANLADELTRYRIAVAPVYHGLRRLIVQLAALAILAQGRQATGCPDHPTLAAAKDRLEEVHDGLAAVSVPDAVSHSHPSLRQCAADLQWVVERLLGSGQKVLKDPNGSDLAGRLDRAYRALRGAANEQLGFAVVDMRQSCCCLISHGADGKDAHPNH